MPKQTNKQPQNLKKREGERKGHAGEEVASADGEREEHWRRHSLRGGGH